MYLCIDMVKLSRYLVHAVRFHQWSRKAYAVFLSLGKVVVIGRVGKTITEASLVKVAKYKKRGCTDEQHGTRILIHNGSPDPRQQLRQICCRCGMALRIMLTAAYSSCEGKVCALSAIVSRIWSNEQSVYLSIVKDQGASCSLARRTFRKRFLFQTA